MEGSSTDFQSDFFQTELGSHKDKKVIWVKFEKNFNLIRILKQTTKSFWSNSQKCWYVADNNFNRSLFGIEKQVIGKDVLMKIGTINLPELKRFQEHIILKGYSQNTLKTYTVEFAQLLYILKDFPVQSLSVEKIRSYLLYCHQTLELSENQIHSRMNALKFYFEKVLRREKMLLEIPRPKKKQILPKYLDQEDIKNILKVTENPKHRLVIKLCYGMGLRVSEIVNLKVEDISSSKKRVFIENSKGKKDRYINLPDSVLDDLKVYQEEFKPQKYLFEGQYGGQYTIRSVQQIFKTAMKKAKINKTVGIHALRHSYATHLLEFGTDISLIQKLLGHNDIKTTLIYTHVAKSVKNVQSPLDKI